MANAQTTLARILSAVQAYKAAGAGFNTLLGVFLESSDKDDAENLKSVKSAYADAFASAYQGVVAVKDADRRTLWAGWTTYTSDASELSSLLKLGRAHVSHAFDTGMGRNAATAYRAQLVKAATNAALIKAMADAPADASADAPEGETINAAEAPANNTDVDTDESGTAVAITFEGVRFIREAVLIAVQAELDEVTAELMKMQAAEQVRAGLAADAKTTKAAKAAKVGRPALAKTGT